MGLNTTREQSLSETVAFHERRIAGSKLGSTTKAREPYHHKQLTKEKNRARDAPRGRTEMENERYKNKMNRMAQEKEEGAREKTERKEE